MAMAPLVALESPWSHGFDSPLIEWRRLFSEFMGTFLLVLAGVGGAMVDADSGPTFCAVDAVPRMVLTRPNVSSSSTAKASVVVKPLPGSVAPSFPTSPRTSRRTRTAAVAPANWTTM